MRVIVLALVAFIVLPSAARAQSSGAYVIPSVPAPRDPLPRFTIAPRGGVLPSVGLPLPQLGLRPPPAPSPLTPHNHGGGSFQGPHWPVMVFYVPQAPAAAWLSDPTSKPIDRIPPTGRLILEVEPKDAQVFADGYYVGTSEDFDAGRGGGVLDAGIHRLDVSATGYDPVTVDLKITAGQSLTYRAALQSLPPPLPVPPTTFYLIPGCYLGNVPPKDARLPASCDQSRTLTWQR